LEGAKVRRFFGKNKSGECLLESPVAIYHEVLVFRRAIDLPLYSSTRQPSVWFAIKRAEKLD
jgi:hypothetical protein